MKTYICGFTANADCLVEAESPKAAAKWFYMDCMLDCEVGDTLSPDNVIVFDESGVEHNYLCKVTISVTDMTVKD